jgi:hypothetical protein
VRELVSRLSDDEVRKLLLDQLDRRQPRRAPRESVDPHVGNGRECGHDAPGFRGIKAARTLPETLRTSAEAHRAMDPRSTWYRRLLAALLVSGWIIEWFYRRALRDYRTRLGQTSPRPSRRARSPGFGLLLDFGIVVEHRGDQRVFPPSGTTTRIATTYDLIIVVVIVRVTALLARFLLGHGRRRKASTVRGCAGAYAVSLAVTFATLSLCGSRSTPYCWAAAPARRPGLCSRSPLSLGVPLTIGPCGVRTPSPT